MRALVHILVASWIGGVTASGFEIPLIRAAADCQYLVPSTQNGGDQLEESWRGIAEPVNISEWSQGQIGIGFDTAGVRPFAEHLVHDVMQEMYQENASLFVRIPFDGVKVGLEGLLLHVRYDDGFVAWINGVEVARANAPIEGELSWNSRATTVHPIDLVLDPETFDVSASISALRDDGPNYLTIQALNLSRNNQDFLMAPELTGFLGSPTELVEEGAPCQVLVPSEQNGGTALGDTWRTLDHDASHWTSGTLGVGYSSNPEDIYHQFIGTDTLIEMRYNTASAFVRVGFDIPDPDRLAAFRSLWIRARFEDGFAMWINGTEVLRYNAPEGELDADSSASAVHPDSSAIIPTLFDISDHLEALQVGENLLAIQILNNIPGSADVLMSPRLIAESLPPSAFCDDQCLKVVDSQCTPQAERTPATLSTTFGIATGRFYRVEVSEDLINWIETEEILGRSEDNFRRTITHRFRPGTQRFYTRLREINR